MTNSTRKLIYQFKVTLIGIAPKIWRRIQVPEQYTFWDLHVAIQDAMGWLDYHLHAFDLRAAGTARAVEIGIPDKENHVHTIAGWTVGISDHFIRPGVSLPYEYDFGDGWVHEVLLEAVSLAELRAKSPKCVAGERACPPEDCGGTAGYYHLVKVLKNPKHREYPELVGWLKAHARNYWPYHPAHFDPNAIRFSNPTKRWEQAFSQATDK